MEKRDNQNIAINQKFKDFIIWNLDTKQQKSIPILRHIEISNIVSDFNYLLLF